MSKLALKLIQECYETKDPYLDLGMCGLRDDDFFEGSPVDKALRRCFHLETFVLSDEWYDFDRKNLVQSFNKGRQPNRFTVLPPALASLENLLILIFAGNENEAWDVRFVSLPRLTKLRKISLTNNNIEEINGLQSLTSLVQLDISCNSIKEINWLEALTALEQLDLSGNLIRGTKGMEALTALKVLDLSANLITELKGFENLTALAKLDLRGNIITEIKGLETLTSLRALYLGYNQILEIKGLETLTALEVLNLSSNRIPELNALDNLTALLRLDLGYNQITEIKGLDSLISLKQLILNDNKIDEVKGLDNLMVLEELWMNGNGFTEIKGLGKLTALQELGLSKNKLTKIKGLENLVVLKRLILSSNRLKQIEGLERLIDLEELLLDNNQITEIKGLDNLLAIRKVDLSVNWIQDVMPLMKLLQRNQLLLEIVTEKGYVDFEDYVSVYGNPLEIPPIEIVKQGSKAILNYFKALENQGVDYLYEAKLLIVGQPRAGKTSLRYKLFDSQAALPEEDKTTRGIDIQRLEFNIKDHESKPRKFYYHIWDFGGQQIYQTTHQFFLTHRSLYVLVMDTSNDSVGNHDTAVNYWLQAVELLGGSSPLLLVRNEKNERKAHLDIQQKKGRFSLLKNEYNVDLNALIRRTNAYNEKREKDFAHLKRDIETELSRLPLVGFPMPKNWVLVREVLQTMSQSVAYISLEKYKAICSQFEVVEEERQLELSRIFHDLGVFLHFQDYGILDDFIVLQNTWATDAVFAVLDNEAVKAANGRFTDHDLEDIWKAKGYSKEVHKKLLRLMMQFELCYQVDKGKPCAYIVPEMLPDSAPLDCLWQPNDDLTLQYRYDFMPRGLLTRLIVRLNRNIHIESNQQWVWKTGVRIDGSHMDCPNTYAEITEAWDNKQLTFRIQGPFSKELMSKLTHEIDELNKDYFKQVNIANQTQTSSWYKTIPCNCITCEDNKEKHLYDYNELLKRKEFGKNTIECKEPPFDTVNIHQLLEGVFSKKINPKINTMKKESKKIFISYSKEDLALVNMFLEHLTGLQLDGKVAHWYCTELTAGSDWHQEIQDHFDQSDIVCFMISPHFMKTRYIHEHEIKKAFERKAKDPTFRIVPIILDFCKWTANTNNLGQFTALPYTAKPIVDFKNQNMAWYIVQECLRLMIEKDLQPVGEDFYTSQALPKDVLKLLERIVAGQVDA